MDEDLFLRLTDIGREVAEQTYEKHCFFTHLLMEAGVEPEIAEQEACRIEHVISEDSFQKLANPVSEETFKCKVNRGRGGNLMWKQVLLIDDGLL